MKFKQAIKSCHVRSSIYRTGKPEVKYPKNHQKTFAARVPEEDQACEDWEEHDPRDSDDGSLAAFND